MFTSDAVRESFFFRGMTPHQIDTLLALAHEKKFIGGETVVRQFDQAQDILIIMSGEVRVKGFQGEDLALLGAGSVLGEISLVDNSPRSATVISKGETLVAMIPTNRMAEYMEQDPHLKATVYENLSRLLCSRLRNANIQLDAAIHARGMSND